MKIDFQSPEFITNPYPVYAQLREQAPVYPLEPGVWLVTRYHDVEYLLKNLVSKDIPAMFNQRYGRNMNDEPVFRFHNNFWALMDTPRRKLVVKALNSVKATELRILVQKSAEQLVDKWIDCGQADLMKAFACPFPVLVTCDMLNIELEQELDFMAETQLMVRLAEPELLNAAELEVSNAAALRLEAFFRKICHDRRQQPGDDLISQLLVAEDEGERLSEDEIIANLIVLFVAGYGATANAICNLLRLLYVYPEQRKLLLANPELLPRAIEEGLRVCSSGPITFRTATEAFEFKGVQIAKGDTIYLALDSANHDPEVFVEPDRFWIDRPASVKKSLAFGLGGHYCLGAKLGNLELEVALETLLRRLPNLTIDIEQLKWETTWVLKNLESLPAKW